MGKIVLTGVDSSQTAIVAAEKAAELAAGIGAELHVVTAYSTGSSDNLKSMTTRESGSTPTSALDNLIESQGEAALKIADGVAGVLKAAYPDLTVITSAVEGSPANVLLHQASALNADTLVVGNKNLQGFARMLGSVARKIVADAPCDLYIVNTTQN